MSPAAHLRARLAQVDASISEQKLRLQELEDVRRGIQQELDCIVYPVLTLPPEITSGIFIQCLPPSQVFIEEEDKDSPRPSKAPLLLLRICRVWRSIAISTPQLWVDLHVDLWHDMPDLEALEEFIEDWFNRAASCPLSFSVRGEWYAVHPRHSDTIRATLFRYAPRFETLGLRWPNKGLFKKLAGIGPFPLLENLSISLDEDNSEEGSWNLEIFRDASRLRQLDFGRAAKLSMFPVTCTVLSKMACQRSIGVEELLNLLALAPSLMDLTCSIVHLQDDPSPQHMAVVTHNHLHTLRLSTYASAYFLSLVRPSALKNLHLDIACESDWVDDGILTFLTHSSTSLRAFSTGLRTPVTVECFSDMSGLTNVELCDPEPEFLSDFFSRLELTGFLPCLQSLAFQNIRQIDVGELTQMLSSRCDARDGVAKLQSFRWIMLNGQPISLDESSVATLRGLVASGMEIYIGHEERNLI
ncbi:hypothetical protein FB451DRAFT_1371012 [Mycena latifolia]|nr:hypothetical protein FB451DRAFT_1371012 [Mycena latifolia]